MRELYKSGEEWFNAERCLRLCRPKTRPPPDAELLKTMISSVLRWFIPAFGMISSIHADGVVEDTGRGHEADDSAIPHLAPGPEGLRGNGVGDMPTQPEAGQKPLQYDSSLALLIGNWEYANPVWTKLESIPQEMDALKAELSKQGFKIFGDKVHYNLDTDQMRKVLVGCINQTVGLAAGKMRLFIFYSGHGETLTGRGYLVPVDAPGTKPDDASFIRKALDFEEIKAIVSRSDARHVLFCLDSCFAGDITLARGADGPPAMIRRVFGLRARQFITAGERGERVPGKSFFTPYLINGISGDGDSNSDGYVTGQELYHFVKAQVATATNGENLPAYGMLPDPAFRGDFVFKLAEGSVVDPPLLRAVPVTPGPEVFRDSTYSERPDAERAQALRLVQTVLKNRGLYAGSIDGAYGPITSAAIVAWQRSKGLEETGLLDEVTLEGLLRLSSDPGGIEPADAKRNEPFANGLGMLFVPVPGTDVLFSVWETRNRDYQVFVRDTGREWKRPHFQQTETHPVVKVSWNDADAFCKWLSRRESRRYRLPTDREWSHAAGLHNEPHVAPSRMPGSRGNPAAANNSYYFGAAYPPPNYSANLADAGAERYGDVIPGYRDGFVRTAPVGQYDPSPEGLFDLCGNVWEWCSTPFEGREGPGVERVARGAGWADPYEPVLLPAWRYKDKEDYSSESVGFRIVLELKR